MQANTQLTHADHRSADRKFPLRIIADDITSPPNVGSLFRLCDAFAIEKLYLCGNTPAPPNSKLSKTSRSTEKHVAYESCDSAEELVITLKRSGALIIALEITASSVAIGCDDFVSMLEKYTVSDSDDTSDNTTVCLILGSENSGISEALLSLSDITVHIPMYGNNSSMNVISAASIACFEITSTWT